MDKLSPEMIERLQRQMLFKFQELAQIKFLC